MEWEAGYREEAVTAMGDINPRGAASRALYFIIMCPAFRGKTQAREEEGEDALGKSCRVSARLELLQFLE